MVSIWFLISITIILTSISVYYLLRDKKIQIIVQNYDHKSSFVLGAYNVCNFSNSESAYAYNEPLTSFGFESQSDEADFLSKIVNNKNFFGIMNFSLDSSFSKNNYVFHDNNAFYVLRKDKIGRYFIQPIYSLYTYETDNFYKQYRFICPVDALFDNEDFEIEHSISEEEFFAFYEKLSGDLVQIDYDSKTVYVQAYDIFNSIMTDDYPMEIRFNENILSVTFQDSSKRMSDMS